MSDSTSKIGSGAASGAVAGGSIGGPYGAAIGAVAGGVMGAMSSNDDADQAQANMQKALAQLDAMGVPPDLAKPLLLQQLQQGGMLTPAYEQALSSDNLNASQIQENPSDKTNLTATLAALKGMSQGGLNPEQMAAAQQLKNQTNANTSSQIQGLLQRQQMQGKGGSGDTLAAGLNAVQNGAQNESQGAANIGAQGFEAQRGALQSLLSGQGQLRQQDIGVLGQNAQMKQQADMWKAQNSSARQARNVADTNVANQANWGRTNQVNDTNTQMANQELERQRQAQQQMWQNQLNLANAKAGNYNTAAQNYMGMANNSNQAFGNTMQGVVGAGTAYAKYKNGQQNSTNSDEPPAISTADQQNYGLENYQMPSSNNSMYGYTMAAEGGTVSNGGMMQHPDENMNPPNAGVGMGVSSYADGGRIMNFLNGGPVPGTPMHPGNNYANDTVPAMLSPGEIVVPNTHSHNPAMAANFVKDQIEDRQMEAHGPMFKRLHDRLKKIESKKAV